MRGTLLIPFFNPRVFSRLEAVEFVGYFLASFEVFFSGPTLFGGPQALPHFWLADGCTWNGIWQLAFCKCVHSDFLFEIGVSH